MPEGYNVFKALTHTFQSTKLNVLTTEGHAMHPITPVPVNASIAQAMDILNKGNFLGAPIEDLEAAARYVGFIDMADIAAFIVGEYAVTTPVMQEVTTPDGFPMLRWAHWDSDIKSLELKGQKLSEIPVSSIVNCSGKDPLLVVETEGSLYQLLEVFARGLRRAIVAQAGHPVSVISQTRVIKYLSDNRVFLGDLVDRSVDQLGLNYHKQIIAVHGTASTIHGFHLMKQHGVAAVAVVDDNGLLIGNLSSSDLRGLTADTFHTLLLETSEFLKSRNKGELPVVVKGDGESTLGEILAILTATDIHRVWLVNKAGKPTGIVTMTDCIKFLVDNNPERMSR